MKDACNRIIASSVGCIFAETVTLPADVIKTRLQVQKSKIREILNEVKTITIPQQTQTQTQIKNYNGMFDAATSIVKNEGFTALFKGLQPALLRQVTSFFFCVCAIE